MKSMLVENDENGQRIYDLLVLKPDHLGIFSNELAVNIVNEIAKQPMCVMDLSKKLKEHEQKIYYHVRKMRDAGILKLNGTETRYGMTAKIFELVSPVIAAKLDDSRFNLRHTENVVDPEIQDFFAPFVKDNNLNAKIIIGDPYSHGRFDESATEGPFVTDLALILGRFAGNIDFPCYKLDTEVNEKDLHNNLILIGNSKTNVIIDRINPSLPASFDEKKDYRLISKSGNDYTDPRIGLVIKTANPFNKNKKILVIGGVGSRGTRAAILACTKFFSSTFSDADIKKEYLTRILKGFDRSGTRVIDAIEVLE